MGEPVKIRRYFANSAALMMFFVRIALWFLIVVLSSTTNRFLDCSLNISEWCWPFLRAYRFYVHY